MRAAIFHNMVLAGKYKKQERNENGKQLQDSSDTG